MSFHLVDLAWAHLPSLPTRAEVPSCSAQYHLNGGAAYVTRATARPGDAHPEEQRQREDDDGPGEETRREARHQGLTSAIEVIMSTMPLPRPGGKGPP